MPELPEVETTRRGLAPHLEGQRVADVIVRNRAMRQPVPRHLDKTLVGKTVQHVARRGKYLLMHFAHGTLIIHLGMSGRLWLVNDYASPEKHDHFDLVFENGTLARLRDPRRFGLVLWQSGEAPHSAFQHPLLKDIGVEPFSAEFTGTYLHAQTRKRSAAIKNVLMDSHVVAGIGNIYASEALFRAGIKPQMPAFRISLARYETLVEKIRETLELAIQAGGSTLRDYVGGDGNAGWFQNEHLVYGRAGEPCTRCGEMSGAKIKLLRQGQRATFYCPHCQK